MRPRQPDIQRLESSHEERLRQLEMTQVGGAAKFGWNPFVVGSGVWCLRYGSLFFAGNMSTAAIFDPATGTSRREDGSGNPIIGQVPSVVAVPGRREFTAYLSTVQYWGGRYSGTPPFAFPIYDTPPWLTPKPARCWIETDGTLYIARADTVEMFFVFSVPPVSRGQQVPDGSFYYPTISYAPL